jgi:hypothetical protein
LAVAAANWHALATYVGTLFPHGRIILFDIGSTTSDLIPIENGVCVARGKTDYDRLKYGELVYLGVKRTPMCAVLRGPFATEFFATTQDLYVYLGKLPEDATDTDTADSRPATKELAKARLARMMCHDATTITDEEIQSLVKNAQEEIMNQLCLGLDQVDPETAMVVCSGIGEFLARDALKEVIWGESKSMKTMSLSEKLGPELSGVAPALAVAKLAESH